MISIKDRYEVYKDAIALYGPRHQLTVAIEEMSELTKEICKNNRGNDNRDHIIEEVADVYVMLEQLEIIFNIEPREVLEVMNAKIERLAKRVNEAYEKDRI